MGLRLASNGKTRKRCRTCGPEVGGQRKNQSCKGAESCYGMAGSFRMCNGDCNNMDKKVAIARIVQCAKLYDSNLKDCNMLFMCMDKHKNIKVVEVEFKETYFLHMTGVKAPNGGELRAGAFYNRAISNRLSEHDFELAADSTTEQKLKVLPTLMSRNLGVASMSGDYDVLRPRLYTEKLAGGVRACMGFVKDEKSGYYVPNTVLNEDIRHFVSRTDRIILTYRKSKGDTCYQEIVYAAKKIDWKKIRLPKGYEDLPLPSK